MDPRKWSNDVTLVTFKLPPLEHFLDETTNKKINRVVYYLAIVACISKCLLRQKDLGFHR